MSSPYSTRPRAGVDDDDHDDTVLLEAQLAPYRYSFFFFFFFFFFFVRHLIVLTVLHRNHGALDFILLHFELATLIATPFSLLFLSAFSSALIDLSILSYHFLSFLLSALGKSAHILRTCVGLRLFANWISK